MSWFLNILIFGIKKPNKYVDNIQITLEPLIIICGFCYITVNNIQIE